MRRQGNSEWTAALPVLLIVGGVVLALLAAEPALASDTGMPWEAPLQTLQRSITGPTALVVAVLGIAVCGALLVFGGDMQEFTRRMIYVILAVAILVSAGSLITLLFGFTAAAV